MKKNKWVALFVGTSLAFGIGTATLSHTPSVSADSVSTHARTATHGSVIVQYLDTDGNQIAPARFVVRNATVGTSYHAKELSKTFLTSPQVSYGDYVEGVGTTVTETRYELAEARNTDGTVQGGTQRVAYIYRAVTTTYTLPFEVSV